MPEPLWRQKGEKHLPLPWILQRLESFTNSLVGVATSWTNRTDPIKVITLSVDLLIIPAYRS